MAGVLLIVLGIAVSATSGLLLPQNSALGWVIGVLLFVGGIVIAAYSSDAVIARHPQSVSGMEMMQQLYPECPICGSKDGYEPSIFYPQITCKSCKSEWVLYPYGMKLKERKTADIWKELLNKKYSFDFWREVRKAGEPKTSAINRIFAPMDYLGGTQENVALSSGYIIFKSETIVSHVGEEDSKKKQEIEIPIQKIDQIFLKDNKWLQVAGWLTLGVLGINAMNKKSLVIEYSDDQDQTQRAIFDFHDDENAATELKSMLDTLRRKR